ncbi:MAG TPA: TonB-dependent receptor plug domain-containing protein, partial [Nitrospiraceae bacterium]|nr:TonB-dependent receptor plug domain-containing protein [Nitrospiraceae bacterium]
MHALRKFWVTGAAVLTFVSVSAHAQAARSFDIPAGHLGTAVARLGQQADVMITADPQLLRGLRTAGLRGEYTPEQALNALLIRNHLIAQPDGQGGFIVAAAPAPRRPAVADEPVSEVTVTGQKIRRTLLDTQSSVGVVTAEDIETKDLTTFREAFKTMANVMGGDWLDSGFVIRGVNSEGLTSGAPLASLYIDGAAQTKMGTRRGSRGLWDVEQVEVYRGPQSTLSGRAALAGAVYISTRDPSHDSDA